MGTSTNYMLKALKCYPFFFFASMKSLKLAFKCKCLTRDDECQSIPWGVSLTPLTPYYQKDAFLGIASNTIMTFFAVYHKEQLYLAGLILHFTISKTC